MIKTTELRIGNYVQLNNKPEEKGLTRIIAHLYKDSVALLNMQGISGHFAEDVDPILITEQRLFLFKFKKVNEFSGIGYKLGNFLLSFVTSIKGESSCYECEWIPNKYPFEKRSDVKSGILYVHELQNLYFALTGEELNQVK